MTLLTHNNTEFYIESFDISGEIKHQAFMVGTDYALTDIEENKAICVMKAIKVINEQ